MAPGTLIRYAFGVEAVLNIVSGTGMLMYPEQSLAFLVEDPITDINRFSIAQIQWIAMFVYCLTAPLLLGIPNTRTAIESRPIIYWTLFSGELFLISLFIHQANAGASMGIGSSTLYMMCGSLAPLALWRLFVLFVRPDFMGRYIDNEIKKSQ